MFAAQPPTVGQQAAEDREELDAGFWSDVPDGEIIRPCGRDSEDAHVAMNALRQLDARIEELEAGEEHEPLARAILDLLRTPCFRLAMEADRLPRPDSAESLSRWWHDGGRYWLWSYIELPEKTINGVSFPQIVVPPDDRPTLSGAGRGHVFGPLLCPDRDELCRAETAGWRIRAEEAIERTPGNVRLEKLADDLDYWHWEKEPSYEVIENAVRTACVEGVEGSVTYRTFREGASPPDIGHATDAQGRRAPSSLTRGRSTSIWKTVTKRPWSFVAHVY